jgi:glycosyltransferase involved in cell wall biosynthesis
MTFSAGAMPQVSIIIATHNRPHLLPRAVESAFAAADDVEVVVVDDASIDATAEICRKLAGIKYVRIDRNQQTAGARNIGILNSTAQYIGFLDDDDWRLPDVLNKQIEILNQNPEIGLVYAPFLAADQAGQIIDIPAIPAIRPQGDIFWNLMTANSIGCLTAVFRKSCLSRVGMLDQSLSGIDDLDLWIRIAELYEIAALDKPVAVWRIPHHKSGQGSSDPFRLLAHSIPTFDGKWSKLPRAVREKEKLAEIRPQFIDNLIDLLLKDAAQTLDLTGGLKKFYRILKLHPPHLLRRSTFRMLSYLFIFKFRRLKYEYRANKKSRG